jgi:very-short-patch-repair endonuclease
MQYQHYYKNKPWSTFRRRKLRRESTNAERLFWIQVKNKTLGYKFRRQFNIGRYIVDFYCHELKLIVEIDGFTHDDEDVQKKDVLRQRYLEDLGYKMIRYTDDQVLNDTEATIQDLKNKCDELSSVTPPNLP